MLSEDSPTLVNNKEVFCSIQIKEFVEKCIVMCLYRQCDHLLMITHYSTSCEKEPLKQLKSVDSIIENICKLQPKFKPNVSVITKRHISLCNAAGCQQNMLTKCVSTNTHVWYVNHLR